MREFLFVGADRAECLNLDLRFFYPRETGWVHPVAKQACVVCPVRCECLLWALTAEAYGVWAGLSEQTRWDIRDRIGRQEISLGQAVAEAGCEPDPDDC